MELSISQAEVGLLLLIIPFLYHIFKYELANSNSRLFKAFPVVGLRDELFPIARARCRSLWKTAEWSSEGYSKFIKHDTPYLIPILSKGLIVLLPLKQMKKVYKLPEHRLDIFGTLNEQIQAKYTVRNQEVIRDPWHKHMIPSQLTRQLNLFTVPTAIELDDCLNSLWGTDTDWKEVQIWQSCFHLIARTTNRVLCGTPLCRDEEYINCLEDQSTALFGGSMLISITPKPLRFLVGALVRWWCLYYARKFSKICTPHIEKRINATDNMGDKEQIKDGLQLIIDETISRGDPTQLAAKIIADRLLITNNVSVHGAAFTLYTVIMNLVTSDPSLGYIDTLRKECRDVFNKSGHKWTPDAIRKLRLVDSTIRESMRISPFSSVAISRTVVDPLGISISHGDSSVLIPQGTTLALPIESIHLDENIYPNASRFNPFRFVDPNYEGGESEDSGSTTTKAATTADDQFFSFGTTRNPCPGRFLAVHGMKLVIAHVLLNYDIECANANTKYELTNLLNMKVHNTNMTLRIRRHAGLERGPLINIK